MVRNRQELSGTPRPKSPGWRFSARSIHSIQRFISTTTLGRIGHPGRRSIAFHPRRRRSFLEQHLLPIHVLSSEFAARKDFKRRGPAALPICREHAGVDQEHSSSEAAPNVSRLLYRVGDDNMSCIVGCQNLFYFGSTLFLAPLVVAAKP